MTLSNLQSRLFLLIKGEFASEAIRALAITLIPGVLLGYLTSIPFGIALSLGALTASLVDLPTQLITKWRTAVWSVPLYFIVALVVGLSVHLPLLLVTVLVVCGFCCTMMGAFGSRMGLLGTTAMLLAAFTIGFRTNSPLFFASLVAAGAAIYHSISLVIAVMQPHRALKHALQECIRTTAQLLRAKADCYKFDYPLETAFERIAALHIRVSDQQEQIRERLISRKSNEKNLTDSERVWWARAYALMDLYEQITAIDKDYETIRETLQKAEALTKVEQLIRFLADEVETLAFFRQTQQSEQLYLQNRVLIGDLIREIRRIRDVKDHETSRFLSDTLRNVQDMFACFYRIRSAREDEKMDRILANPAQRQSFLTYPSQGWKALKGHLHFQSPIFIFALRLSTLMLLGGLVGILLPDPTYTYWILLTIIIVARPVYAVTQKRNTERLIGTLGGALVGVFLLWAIPNTYLLLAIAAFFLYGFLVYNRPVYLWSVWCITPAVIIGLQLYEGDFLQILGSRLSFTLIGCALALIGWYLVPYRTSKHFPAHALRVSMSLQQFLQEILHAIEGKDVLFEIRIARKESHISMAALSDALLHLIKEPGKSKKQMDQWKNFQQKAYRINGKITSLALTHFNQDTSDSLESISAKIDSIKEELISLRQLV
jgi:uncharacterized membrane protein YccC